MAKEFFKDLPDTSTPLTAARINGLLNGEESMGNISVENVASRNLFNLNTISIGGLDENGTIVDSSSVTINNLDISQGIINFTANAWRGIISDFIKVDSGSALILSGTFSADNYFYRVVSYNANKEFISFFDDFYTMPHNISIPDGVSYIRILLGRGAEAGSINFNGLQLEEGSTATSYVPYLNLEELQKKSNDTGWIDLSLGSDVSTEDWNKLRFRKINEIVYINGLFRAKNITGLNKLIGTLPKGFRPGPEIDFISRDTSNVSGDVIIINSIGQVFIFSRIDGQTPPETTGVISHSFIAEN